MLNEAGDVAFAVRKGSPKLKAALDAFTRGHGQSTAFGNITLRKYLQQTRWARNATAPARAGDASSSWSACSASTARSTTSTGC